MTKTKLEKPHKPLVTFMVYNYNYGEFLTDCLESIANQTYDNIEIVFYDNASTDNSWEIAQKIQKKYPELISISRNHKNLGPVENGRRCFENARGKYVIYFCADDTVEPEYTQKCVDTFQKHPEIGFVMTHFSEIDEKGTQELKTPFYNQSCIIPGKGQAAVYVMASVNPCVGQIMYNRYYISEKMDKVGLGGRWFLSKFLDFNICMEFPVAYLAAPLVNYRLHKKSISTYTNENLIEIMGMYTLIYQMVDVAKEYNYENVTERLNPAIDKLGNLSIRYCVRALEVQNEKLAKKYYHLAHTLIEEPDENETLTILDKYWHSNIDQKTEIAKSLFNKENLIERTLSYPPPEGSFRIED